MKILKLIVSTICDPISTFISKSFPEFAYKILNKNIFIQFAVAFVITLVVVLVSR